MHSLKLLSQAVLGSLLLFPLTTAAPACRPKHHTKTAVAATTTTSSSVLSTPTPTIPAVTTTETEAGDAAGDAAGTGTGTGTKTTNNGNNNNPQKADATQSTTTAESSTPAVSGGKRGVLYNDNIPISSFGGYGHIKWQWNWDSDTAVSLLPGSEFVPMLWSNLEVHTTLWAERVDKWLAKGSKYLIGFNEPDIDSQAKMSVFDAVETWNSYMKPYAGRAQLGTPAVTNGGYDWLDQFLTQCKDCGVNFVTVHWYNPYDRFDDLQLWVDKVCDRAGGKPVWLTEFQAYGDLDQQAKFLDQAIPYLEGKDCIARYSYGGSANNDQSLIDGNGLSTLGVKYASAK